MKNKVFFFAGLFLFAASVFLISQERSAAQKKNVWEYRTRIGSIRELPQADGEKELNKYGEDGWELIAIEPKSEQSLAPVYVFKRKRE